MRLITPLLLLLLLAACGGKEPTPEEKEAAIKAAAKVAERNLVKIRDGVLAYYRKNGAAPESMDNLADFGISDDKLEASDDYAPLGYHFYSLDFSKDGAMTQGWFEASPMAGRKAYRVRLNGVTGEFDYADAEAEHTPAPSANTGK